MLHFVKTFESGTVGKIKGLTNCVIQDIMIYRIYIRRVFMKYFNNVIKKYATFSGRARRKEYWMFALVSAIISLVLGFIDNLAGLQIAAGNTAIPVLTLLFELFILVPSLAVTARRLHDIGKSGWWILISLIPIIGEIVLFIFTVIKGNAGANKYGEDPKAGAVIA